MQNRVCKMSHDAIEDAGGGVLRWHGKKKGRRRRAHSGGAPKLVLSLSVRVCGNKAIPINMLHTDVILIERTFN